MTLLSTTTRPVEFVTSEPLNQPHLAYPDMFRDRIQVVTLHDGDIVPDDVRASEGVRRMEKNGELELAVEQVRDWGADLVAHELSNALRLDGHHRVRIARAVVDFNRFPGVTRSDATHMQKLALGGPIAEVLDDSERRLVLARYYDGVSSYMEQIIQGQLIILSIHTYDQRNPTFTQRPEVSLLSRSDSYQKNSKLPFGLFDPLFPDVLVESSAKRVLRDRVALTLEKAGVHVEHNYPYLLPDGSLEIRSQPWFFFHRLRQRFELEFPETADRPAYVKVWEMLFNTNLRRAGSSALSRYLHRYCAAPLGEEAMFEEAGAAYSQIRDYLERHPGLVDGYRRSNERTSAITVEVRKDLVWHYENGRPVRPNPGNARRIGRLLALGIATFLRTDIEDMR